MNLLPFNNPVLSVLTVLSYACQVVGQAPQRPNSLEAIVSAWQYRQDRATSIRAQWTGTETERLFPNAIRMDHGIKEKLAPEPPKAITFNFQTQFILDSSRRARVDYSGSTWSPAVGDMTPREFVDVFDGMTRRTLHPRGAVSFPNYHVKKGNPGDVARSVLTTPILIVYRSLDAVLGVGDPSQLQLTSTRGVVDGKPCLIVRMKDGSVWVDPERDYLPVRYNETARGKTVRTVELSYRQTEKGEWQPEGWRDVRTAPTGEVPDTASATVTELILNGNVSDADFEIKLPKDTWVRNYVTNEKYIDRGWEGRRTIAVGEFNGKNFDELRQTDAPGHASRKAVVLGLAVPAFMLLCVIYLFYRRHVTAKVGR